ncbi:MAG: M3 family metallopeptidase [Candidatus Thorarchaeota archaeon]
MTETEMTWDLSPLVKGASADEVKKLLDDLVDEAKEFGMKYDDSIPTMKPPDIKEMLVKLEELQVRIQDAVTYGILRFAAKTTDKEAAQLNDWSRKANSTIRQVLTPLELRLGVLLMKNCEYLNDSVIDSYKHYLERLKNEAPYNLSEAEEKLIIQKNLNGVGMLEELKDAWVSEKTYIVEVNGEKKTISYPELSSLRMNPDRDVRRMATETLYKSIAEDKLLYGTALRAICADHVSIAKLRGQPSPMTQSLLDQDVDEETIETLLSTIESTSDRFRDFLALKAKFMGFDKLEGSDIVAPFTTNPVWNFNFDEARKITVESFTSFDPALGKVVDVMFANKRIDAANREGKQYGGFCTRHAGAKSSFIFISYNYTMANLYTLAHELGHAVQGHLTYHRQTPLNYRTSSCLAEMGSIFGELLLTDKILSVSESKEQKVEILAKVLDGFFYIVYYVALRALFEKSLYETIEEGKLLDAETICKLWDDAKKRIFADSVEWNPYMEYEWARIPHHFLTKRRFYNFSYSFAQMLVFALYELYKQEGEKFIERFKDLLAAGNTKSVREHLLGFGFDITDPSFWELGAKQANRFLDEFKKLM